MHTTNAACPTCGHPVTLEYQLDDPAGFDRGVYERGTRCPGCGAALEWSVDEYFDQWVCMGRDWTLRLGGPPAGGAG